MNVLMKWILFMVFILGTFASNEVQKQTSKYIGVWRCKDQKKWTASLKCNNQYQYGGYFDNEKHAAMSVNLLCDNCGIKRKNPTIDINVDEIQVQNQTSKYCGVSWNKKMKKWRTLLSHNKKHYFGGYFESEENAAMQVNFLCDKSEIKRKNPTIDIQPNESKPKKRENTTSKFIGVSWEKDIKKWKTNVSHKKKKYCGGYFDIEEHAAMKVNLFCDECEIKRKNPMININLDEILQETKSKIYQSEPENTANKQVKIEDENMLGGFKVEYEDRFMQSNDENKCIGTASCQSSNAKRKRNQNLNYK